MEDVEAVDAHVKSSDKLKMEEFLQDKSELKNVSPNFHQLTESIDEEIEPPENFFDDLLKEEFLDSLAVVDAWSPEAEEKESNSKSKKDEDRGRRNVSAKRNERDNRFDRRRLSPRDRRVSPRGIGKRGRNSRSRSLDRNKRKRTPERDVHRRDRDSYKDRDRGSNRDDNDKDRGNNRGSHKERDRAGIRDDNDKDKGNNRDSQKERDRAGIRDDNDKERGNNRDSHKERDRAGIRDDNDKERGNNRDSHKERDRAGIRDDNDKDKGNNRDSHKERDRAGIRDDNDKERGNNRDSHKERDRAGIRDDNDKDKGNNRDSHKERDRAGIRDDNDKERGNNRDSHKERDRASIRDDNDKERGNNRDSHKERDRAGIRDDNDKDRGNNRDSHKERDRGSNRDRTRNRDKEIDVDKERQRESDKDRDRNRYERRHNESSKVIRKRDSPRRDSYKHGKNSPMKDLDVEKFKSGNREVTGVRESLAEEGGKVNLDTLSQNYIPPSQSSEKRDKPGDDSQMNTSLDTCIKKLDDVLPPGTEYSFDLPRENISMNDIGKYCDESDCYKKNQDRSSRENWRTLSREEEIHVKKEESGMRTVQDRKNMPENNGSASGSKDRSSNDNKKSRWTPNTDKQDSEQDRKREACRSHSLSRETSIHENTNKVDCKFSELDNNQIKHAHTLIKDSKLRTPTLSPISDKRASSSTFEISPRTSEERWTTESVGRRSKMSFELSPISSEEREGTYVHPIKKQRKSSHSAPRKDKMSFERSPERSKMSFEHSPDRSKKSFERSPERKRVPFERSPERRRVPFDHSPERRRKSFEPSPERKRKSYERLRERKRMLFERSPERRRMSFERSPDMRRKSFERSPERRRISFERSPERRRRSFERSPVRSRSRSKDRSSRYRKENSRHSPFSDSSSLSLSDESLSPPRKRRRPRKRKRSPFLIELERTLAQEYANSKKEQHSHSLAAHPEMFNTAVGHPHQNIYQPQPMPYPTVAEPAPAYGQPTPQPIPMQHQPGYPLHPMAPHPPPDQGHLGRPMQPMSQMPGAIMPAIPEIPVHMPSNQMPLMQVPPNAIPPSKIPPNHVIPNMPQIPFPSGQAYPNVVPSAQVLPGSIPLNMALPAPVPPPIYNVPPPNVSLPYNVPPLNASLAISSPNQGEKEKSMGAPPPPPKISQILKEKGTSLFAMMKSSEVNEMGKKQTSIRQGLVSRCEEVFNNLAVHGEHWLPLGHFLLRDLTTVFPRSEFNNLTSPILRTPVVELSFTKLPKAADVAEQQKEETALAQAYLESTPSLSAVEMCASEFSASTVAVVDTCPRCISKTMLDKATQVTPSVMNVGVQFGKTSGFAKFKPDPHGPPTTMNRLQKMQMVRDEYIKKKFVMPESLFAPKQEAQESHLDLKENTEDPFSPVLPKILPAPRKGILKSSKPASSEPQSLAQDVRSSNTSTAQDELSINKVPQGELLKMLGARNLLTGLGLFQQFSSESELLSKLLELQNSVGGAQFSNALSGVLPAAVQQDLFAQLNALKSSNSNEPRGDRPDEFQHPYCRDYNHGRSSRS